MARLRIRDGGGTRAIQPDPAQDEAVELASLFASFALALSRGDLRRAHEAAAQLRSRGFQVTFAPSGQAVPQ